MTTKQPEALRLANVCSNLTRYSMDAHLIAAELRRQHARITELEAQLEAIGAGGVSGPLIGQPQAMPDLSQLTERGAKAWAGVDAQGLREGFTAADMATVSAQGFRDGVASVSAGSEPVAEIGSAAGDCAAFGERALYPLVDIDRFDYGTMLYAHPSPSEGMAGWQPIETAPKDGQAILVTDGMDCYCVEWDEEFDWWTVDDNKLGPFRLRGSAPTHWRELPPPPSSAQREVSNANS